MGKVKVLSRDYILSQVGKAMREKEKPKITPRLLLEVKCPKRLGSHSLE